MDASEARVALLIVFVCHAIAQGSQFLYGALRVFLFASNVF